MESLLTQILTAVATAGIAAIVGYLKRKADLTNIQSKMGTPATGLIKDILKEIENKQQ